MGHRILIVEDSGSFRMVLKVTLQRAGYEVVEAASAERACQLLDGQPIDLVLCDHNMPGMNGLAFVRHLRETTYKFVPIVMLTTESHEKHKAEATELRVRVWITKPFQPGKLLDALQKICPP